MCARVWQTDRQTVTAVAIGRIVIAIPPNNDYNSRDIEDTQTEMLKCPFRTPHIFIWCPISEECARISAQTLYCQNRLTAEYFRRWQYVSIFISFHTIIRKSHGRKPDKPARQQNLTRYSRSRSFKVMHFGIAEKRTTGCVCYNNAGLISKVFTRATLC